MGLRLKFNLILAACFLIGLTVSALLFYQLSFQNAKEELHGQIAVLRAQALAVRAYTSDEISPQLANQSKTNFLPQTVPSFSAQQVFKKFQKRYPHIYYKEAALNPTNPADLAEDWERKLITTLRSNRALKEVVEVRQTKNGAQYTVAYPLIITDKRCLRCHSTPERAPKTLVALYGRENGFGWRMNEIVGAQVFSVPLAIAERQSWQNMRLMMLIMTGVFLISLVLLNILLSYLVISPVTRMAQVAERVSMGDSTVPEYQHEGKDEISSLSQSFNRMRRSLDNAMKMLDG